MYIKISKLMEERGLTPYQVSKDTGIPQSCLSDWKLNKCQPKIDKLSILAKYFNVDITELIS